MRAAMTALCALASFGPASHAAAPETAEGSPVATVRINGHYDNAVGTTDSASAGTITADLIANRPALRTGELLEFVPGLIVTQHSGDGKANQYFLRGFNLDHGTDFATYVDGMPVNMRSHAHGQGYTDLNFLIPELVNWIGYRKGPYFADEGDFASAGAAHIRLADTVPGLASVTLGQDGYRRGMVAATVPLAHGTLLYALDAYYNDGPWDVPERLRQYKGLLRLAGGTAEDGYQLTVMAYRNRWNATDQIPQRAVDAGAVGRYGALDGSDGGDSSRYSLSGALHRRLGDGRLAIDAYAVRSTLELFSNFTYRLADPVLGDQFNQSERRRMAGLNTRYEWQTQPGGIAMRNTVGLQTRYDNLDPVGLYASAARVRTATVREDRVRESSAGLYLENSAQWLPWLKTVAGARHDRYRFDVASNIAGNSGKASDGVTSPKLSLVLGPWQKTELFVNAGRGFHSNDARGTTQTRLADGGASAPVTPLVATRGSEIGARTEWIPGLQSSLALWRLDIDSELVFVGDAGETEPSRASRRRGIEWNNHYVVSSALLFDLDLAFSRARYADGDLAGDRIPGALNRVASFGMTIDDLGRWFGNATIRYFGPRPLIEDNSVRSASTALAYARVGYKLGKETRLALDVFNLFDRRASDIDYYYASRLRGEPADGFEDVHFHPVEPRRARLTLTHAF